MPRKHNHVTVTDLFCGAGGSSFGATQAGAEIFVALNHWELAVETHNSNFPNTLHEVCNISACDPRRYPSTRVLIASPECTHNSTARGEPLKYQKQGKLFGDKIDPAKERSRVTMYDVPRFAEFHRPDVIICENVPQVRYWECWDAWLNVMHVLGYEHREIHWNSMFSWPTPQSRDRIYVVFWRKGMRKPNLEFTPLAFCQRCEKDIHAVQAWKKPHRRWGRYGKRNGQYTYNCPQCNTVVDPYYYAAANAIDFSLPAQKIGDRKLPLASGTIERIKTGLRKFGYNPSVLTANGDREYVGHLKLPMPTQTCTNRFALFEPFILRQAYTHSESDRTTGVTQPVPTQTTKTDLALCAPPFIMGNHAGCSFRELDEALTTVVAQGNHHFGVNLPLIGIDNSKVCLRGVDGALHTQTTSNHQFILERPNSFILDYKHNPMRATADPLTTIEAAAFHHYLFSYYSGGGQAHAVTDPLPTVPTKDRHALVTHFLSKQSGTGAHTALPLLAPTGTITTQDSHALVGAAEEIDLNECTFRMLQPHEIKAAMAFDPNYKLLGTKDDQVRLLGNAVTPPVMKMLMERVMAVL